MSNKFPLVINTNTGMIEEVSIGDNIDLTDSGIANANVIQANVIQTDNYQYANGSPFVSGGSSLDADLANVHIHGGTDGQVLTTDGNNNLSWTTVSSGSGGNVFSATDFTVNTETHKTLRVSQINDSGSSMYNQISFFIDGYHVPGYYTNPEANEITTGWTITGTKEGSPITVTVTSVEDFSNYRAATLSDYIDTTAAADVFFVSPMYYNTWTFGTDGNLSLPTAGQLKIEGGSDGFVMKTDGNSNISFIKSGEVQPIGHWVTPSDNINHNTAFGNYGSGIYGAWNSNTLHWDYGYLTICMASQSVVQAFVNSYTYGMKLKVDSGYTGYVTEFVLSNAQDYTNMYGQPVLYVGHMSQTSTYVGGFSPSTSNFQVIGYTDELVPNRLIGDAGDIKLTGNLFAGQTSQFLTMVDETGSLGWSGFENLISPIKTTGLISSSQYVEAPKMYNGSDIWIRDITPNTAHDDAWGMGSSTGFMFGSSGSFTLTPPSAGMVYFNYGNPWALHESQGKFVIGDSIIITSNAYLGGSFKFKGLTRITSGSWNDGVTGSQYSYTSYENLGSSFATDNTFQFATKSLTATAMNADITDVKIAGGSSGQTLSTDGSGNLVWASSGGLPDGANINIQEITNTTTGLPVHFVNTGVEIDYQITAHQNLNVQGIEGIKTDVLGSFSDKPLAVSNSVDVAGYVKATALSNTDKTVNVPMDLTRGDSDSGYSVGTDTQTGQPIITLYFSTYQPFASIIDGVTPTNITVNDAVNLNASIVFEGLKLLSWHRFEHWATYEYSNSTNYGSVTNTAGTCDVLQPILVSASISIPGDSGLDGYVLTTDGNDNVSWKPSSLPTWAIDNGSYTLNRLDLTKGSYGAGWDGTPPQQDTPGSITFYVTDMSLYDKFTMADPNHTPNTCPAMTFEDMIYLDEYWILRNVVQISYDPVVQSITYSYETAEFLNNTGEIGFNCIRGNWQELSASELRSALSLTHISGGSANQVLSTNGLGNLSWVNQPLSTPEGKFTLNFEAFTAESNQRYMIDAVGSAVTVTLPIPNPGDAVFFTDAYGSWGTNNLTIDGNGTNIMGSSTLVISVDNQHTGVFFNGSEWRTY